MVTEKGGICIRESKVPTFCAYTNRKSYQSTQPVNLPELFDYGWECLESYQKMVAAIKIPHVLCSQRMANLHCQPDRNRNHQQNISKCASEDVSREL